MTGRRRLAAGLALIIAIAVVIGIVLSTGSTPSTSADSNSAAPSGATTVQRRDLVETDTESGTLSYANPQTVYDRLSGTVTWLPSVGQLIHPGQALFDVNNHPVILMTGSTPAYRNLTASDSAGPDILELNQNLFKLGFDADGIVVDDIWQPATTVGIEQLQDSLGEDPTGRLSLGQIVFLPGAQLVSTVDGTVGATGGGGSAAAASLIDPPAHAEFVGLETTTTTPATSTTTSTPTTTTGTATTPATTKPAKRKKKRTKGLSSQEQVAALLALLRAEVAQLRSQPGGSPSSSSPGKSSSPAKTSSPATSSSPSSSGTSHGNSGGGGGSSASEILQTTSDHLIVTVDLAATSQSEAALGEKVTVEMPAGTTMNGVITAVSSVAQAASSSGNGSGGSGGGGGGGNGSSGSTATVPVTIKLLGHVTGKGLDQAAVSVNFAQAKAKNVLSIPVTALLATSGNSYAVQEAAAPHRLIPVTTGLFAAGYVQISGAGIYSGLQVTDSQG